MADVEKSEKKPEGEDKKNPSRPERQSSKQSTTIIDGRTLEYTATAGTLNLKDAKGEDRASIFHVAYILDGVEDASTRPVTFCFNGGPGSSAVWLQFGTFGPRRIDIPDTVAAPPAPNSMVDNAQGILDKTDLVFIDPVGTGFSRPVGDTEAAEFHNVKEDVASVGEFIWRWLSRSGRWNSPKFLAGESYGTTRAAALSNHLQEKGITLNGLVLVSLATNFQTFVFEAGNDLPNVLYLPSYAATAWYHHKLLNRPDSLDELLAEARRFAIEEYAPALAWGDALPAERRRAVAEKLSALTGLPAAELERRKLKIHYLWFARTLLGAGDRTIGRLDGRYVGPDLDPYDITMNRDPSYDAAIGAYTAMVNDFLRRELGWESEDDYAVLSIEVNHGWKWKQDNKLGYVNTTEDLRKAMVANPHLKLLFCNGLMDLATPFFAAEHTVAHLGLSEELRQNVSIVSYEAGHMMYFHPPSLKKLRQDLVSFFEGALA